MLKSVSGLSLYVADAKKSANFYKKLGFRVDTKGGVTKAFMNWFWIQLNENKTAENLGPEFEKEAFAKQKGAGLYIGCAVDEIDTYYASLKKKGLKPSSKPRDWPWGNREFVVRDPDGYKLVFFQKLK